MVLKIYPEKFKTMHLGISKDTPDYEYTLEEGIKPIEKTNSEKDVGSVTVS